MVSYSPLELALGLIVILFSLPHCHSVKVDSTVNPQLINCGHRLLGSPRTRQEAPVTKIVTLEAPENMC